MDDHEHHKTISAWDGLHAQARFRPAYPSEPVVRFVARRFGGLDGPVPAVPLLDIGCGAGRHTLLMARAGHDVVAVDVSREGIEATRGRLEAEGLAADLQLGSMTDLPFDAGRFAGAVSYGVFLYGDAVAFATAVGEAWRVLQPGGRLLVVTRSVDDDRFGMGEQIEPGTVRLASNETNEGGLLMHFLDDNRVAQHFAAFRSIEVDRIHHTDGGGRLRNADLVIEAVK